jgi:AcrR family transcriptional regulator
MNQTVAGKPLRRDAALNRERLLSAALAVFNEQGLDAGVEDVARAAGVGMGTLYRRFPSKQALIDELVGALRRDILALAEAARSATDGTGLERLVLQATELLAAQPACIKPFSMQSESGLREIRQIRAIIIELLAAAQRAGLVRREIVPTDITMLFWAVTAVMETTQAHAPDAWRRQLEILLAGLRPPAAAANAAGVHRHYPVLIEKPLTDAELRAVTGNPPPG